jgi:hypothetical protein
VHVDGTAYFTRLHELLSGLEAGDRVYLTDWRIDATRRPAGPGGLGDGARVFARELRLRLWREHLGLTDDADEGRLLDPVAGFEAWRVELAPALKARWAAALYRVAIDPDGRPLPL